MKGIVTWPIAVLEGSRSQRVANPSHMSSLHNMIRPQHALISLCLVFLINLSFMAHIWSGVMYSSGLRLI